jgi:hypothetical protein
MTAKAATKLKVGDEVSRKKDNAKFKVVSVSRGDGKRVIIEAIDENDLLVELKHTEIE